MSNSTDETVRLCLRAIANEVAAQTGQTQDDVLRLFDLASFISAAEKAEKAGMFIPVPQTMQ